MGRHLDLLLLVVIVLAFAVVGVGEVCALLPVEGRPAMCQVLGRAP